jgi:hypothetical protein
MSKHPAGPLPEDPKVCAMLLCDHAHRDVSSGKFTLLGVFDRITVPKSFPAAHGPFCIYLNLTNMNGSYELAVQILRGEDESSIGETRSDKPIVVKDPLARVEMGMSLPSGLPLEKAGTVVFRLQANGRQIQDQVVQILGPSVPDPSA